MCSALNRGREARTGSRQRRIRRRSQPRFCSSPSPSFPSVLPLPPPHAPHPPVLPNNRNSTPLQGHLKIPRPPSRKRKSSATSPSRKIYKNKGRGRRGRRRRCRTLVQKRSFTRTRKKIPATSTSAKRRNKYPAEKEETSTCISPYDTQKALLFFHPSFPRSLPRRSPQKRGEEGRGEDAEDGGKEAKDVGGSGDAGPEEEEAVGDATKEKLCRKKRRRKVRQNHVTTATARTTNGNENRRGDRE